MFKINSFHVMFLFLLGLLAVGIYIVILIPDLRAISGPVSHQNGIIFDNATNKPYTGVVVDTLNSRILSYEVKDGVKNGDFIISLLDGKKSISGKMINNKNEGKWSYYYLDGNLESEGYFKNDVATDKWIWYYPNGNRLEEGNFVNGKREGMWKIYNDDGSLKENIIFKNGDIINSLKVSSSIAS